MSRLSRFFLALALGLILGLIFGWMLKPVEIIDISPSMLDPGFRSEIVLMVAEIYSTSHDLDSAIYALTTLFSQPPELSLSSSINYCLDNAYAQNDIAHLQDLRDAVNSRLPGVSP